jgi:hypothetical protein
VGQRVTQRLILSIGSSIPVNGSIQFQAPQVEPNPLETLQPETLQPEILQLGTARLPLAGWREWQRRTNSIVWLKGSRQLRQLEKIPGNAGFPRVDAENVTHFRRAGMQMAADQGMVLIELECVSIATQPALRMLCKQALENSDGFMYLGRLIVPFETYTLCLATQSLELANSGGYEQMPELPTQNQDLSAATFVTRDSYNPKFSPMALRQRDDAQHFEALFQNHPLSLVRQDLRLLESETVFVQVPSG